MTDEFVSVPRKPTEAMLRAGHHRLMQLQDIGCHSQKRISTEVYTDMINAEPEKIDSKLAAVMNDYTELNQKYVECQRQRDRLLKFCKNSLICADLPEALKRIGTDLIEDCARTQP